MHIDPAADIDEVPADLRNQAPSVIIACCCDEKQASKLTKAICRPSFGTRTHGNGGRSSKEEYQEEFLYCARGKIVVAGRKGMVKHVSIKLVKDSPLNGMLLVADVDFSVGIQECLNMRVAAIMAESTVVESDDGAKDWSEIVEELLRKSVRVLVFKDSAEDFRNALLRSMHHTHRFRVFVVAGHPSSCWGPLPV